MIIAVTATELPSLCQKGEGAVEILENTTTLHGET